MDKSALFVAKERLRLLTWTSDTSASLRVIDDFLAEKWNCSLSMLHDQGVNDGKLLLASGRIIMVIIVIGLIIWMHLITVCMHLG